MKDIYTTLQELDILFTQYDHPAVFTIAEAAQHCGDVPGGKSKNLLLRNKKGSHHYLVVVRADKQLDLKALADALDETKLSFASAERLMKYLGLTPGAVSPFGLIHDRDHAVHVIVDEGLFSYELLQYHPNVNTETLTIAAQDLKTFLAATGNTVTYMPL